MGKLPRFLTFVLGIIVVLLIQITMRAGEILEESNTTNVLLLSVLDETRITNRTLIQMEPYLQSIELRLYNMDP